MGSVPVAVTIQDDTLRKAIQAAGLTGVSMNKMVRYFALRAIMGHNGASETVFGITENVKAPGGRIYGKIPAEERDRILQTYPGHGFSELVRIGVALAADESPVEAVSQAFMRRGPKQNTS